MEEKEENDKDHHHHDEEGKDNEEKKKEGEEEEKIVIMIEVCQNCKNHQWCTRHDESRYNSCFEMVKSAILAQNDVVVEKNLNIKAPRIGAFEITCNNIQIFSKKNSGLWPDADGISQRVSFFLEDFKQGKDCSRFASIKEQKYSPPPKKRDMTQSIYGRYYQPPEERKAQEEAEKKRLEEERIKNEENQKKESIAEDQVNFDYLISYKFLYFVKFRLFKWNFIKILYYIVIF